MFPRKLKICDAFGIPVFLDFSFIVILLVFSTEFRPFSLGLACMLVLALSVTLHELGHALTARSFGFEAREITLSLIGGCASFAALPRKAWQEFAVAAAGPAVSFAISGAAFSALAFLPVENRWLHAVIEYAFWMNAVLGAFNLMPGFPMDGGRVFRSVASLFTSRERATYWAMAVGRVFAVLLALRGFHSIVSGGPWGFISILIAWMIWREGWREYQMAKMEGGWRGGGRRPSAWVSPPPYGGESGEVEID